MISRSLGIGWWRYATTAIISLTVCWLFLQNTFPPLFQPYQFSGPAQGTTYHVTYYAEDSVVRQDQFDSIFERIDNSLSIYKSNSLISQFNGAVTGIKMDTHLKNVIKKALFISEQSDGIFDVTILPVVRAWGFGPEKIATLPDSNNIRACMKCVGTEKLFLKGDFLGKTMPCVEIDVNGIAQGYTVDVIADFLENNRINNYIVEVGGELRVKGHKQPGGEVMKIGVEGPGKEEGDPLEIRETVSIIEGAVTTSGSYRKQLTMEGRTVSHLMNAKTGYPIKNEMISATVIAKDAITADGYDNVLMNLGIEGALLFLQKHKELEAYMIYFKKDGSVGDVATDGFGKEQGN